MHFYYEFEHTWFWRHRLLVATCMTSTPPDGEVSDVIACWWRRVWHHRLLAATCLTSSPAGGDVSDVIACWRRRVWRQRLLAATCLTLSPADIGDSEKIFVNISFQLIVWRLNFECFFTFVRNNCCTFNIKYSVYFASMAVNLIVSWYFTIKFCCTQN